MSDSQCSFCLSEDHDGRKYLTSDHNDACICSNCAMMLTQYVLNQNSEDDDDEDEITDSTDTTDTADVISADDVYSWRDDGSERECDFDGDATLILNNHDASSVLQALSAYSNYLSDKSDQHEDFVRDACQKLVQENSPYKDKFIDAYKMSYGDDYSDDDIKEQIDSGALIVDDIVSYFSFGNLDQDTVFKFVYSYLACLANSHSIEPPKNLSSNPKEIIRSKMIEAFHNLES